MKRKNWVLLIMVVLSGALLVWLLRTGKAPLPEPTQDAPGEGTQQESRSRIPAGSPKERQGPSTDPSEGDVRTKDTTTNSASSFIPSFLNLRTPIAFYGKVVDEADAPVPGVRVDFGRVDDSPGNYSRTSIMSDANGLFSLTGVTGKAIDVRLEKEGYYFSRSQNPLAFEYSNPHDRHFHRPDPSNPVVFRMKRKGQVEPLVGHRRNFVLPPDGSPMQIDLRSGTIAAPGQETLIVRFQRASLATRYDWSCQLEVPGGGLIEFTDELAFVAPEDGYQDTVQIEMPQSSPQWENGITKRYFLRLADGNYGRMLFRVRTGTTDSIRIEYALNPAGSRNLEFDSTNATFNDK